MIDVIAPLIGQERRKFIPIVAIVLGLAWAFAFVPRELYEAIYFGIVTGAGAVGINETTKVFTKKS